MVRSRRVYRRGAAVVECAVCMPVVAVLLLASLEAATAGRVKQSMVEAAHEGARALAVSDRDSNEAIRRCQAILDTYGIQDAKIGVSPALTQNVPRGAALTLSVTAPMNSNATLHMFFTDTDLRSEVTFVREVGPAFLDLPPEQKPRGRGRGKGGSGGQGGPSKKK